ncbi:hypothetical protein [Fredinandcohnia quinoae]|uniref:Uncharacterized protein n=1 Tax=Fredinandcohnia quinoae TaxID=2918902 RepID=A0AAW5DXS7_9BACI|nr:hypothetical protein [Fredinandcohnia sp. SECRCQ15]MCH1625470.1 hypothetical protein [Fredinandcohnia sp. SECRCQ15]
MRKQWVIVFVSLLAVLSFATTHNHFHTMKSADIQESSTIISGFSADSLPLLDDGKQKLLSIIIDPIFIIIFLKLFSARSYAGMLVRKDILFPPIFYQSNYVGKAL